MEDGRKKRSASLWVLTALIICIMALLLGIEYFVMTGSNRRQAYQTSSVLIDQLRSILTNNERKERALVDSLKEDYITKAKAIAYIIDRNPTIENDIAELIRIANLISVDEIHLFDESGMIYAGTVPPYYGFTFDSGEQMAYFKPMLTSKALSMCQDVTPNTAEGKAMMYAICWNDSGDRMVQVGIEPRRLIEELRANEISEVIDSMPAYDGIEILVADRHSGEIIGSTVARQVGESLAEIDIDLAALDLNDISNFTADVAHKRSYCAASGMDDYVLLIVQERSRVNEDVPVIMMTVFLYLLFAAVGIGLIVRRMTLVILEEQKNANTDPMTELYNRRAYESDIKELEQHPRRSELVYVSLDLNGLKSANDTLGHEAGDELIKGAAQCMKQSYGDYGKLYRIGGDEFVALIFSTDEQLERIQESFARNMDNWSAHHAMSLTMSYGTVRADEMPDQPLTELAKAADKRMYEAKSRFYQASGADRRRRRADDAEAKQS